ncbi:hypothetical protein E1293_08355 [Actinomadura darangshiensis]|uniref:FAD-binding FR-type domain-containing protein n=1 Tax=Actinomadura darangshiensis TaxID=705336 RepID=A0A4R5BK70_9ACTN|nr:hypothetical protein [Actinomadura darangshiensis]TDD87188.1 hypothetical protein E1293_08355 [Actinomadura darangshiensis]
MPQAPTLIGKLAESLMGRRARVLDLGEPAPGFVEVELRAEAPPGGWRPGHEIQVRASATQGRRYTVRTVNGRDPERVTVLATTQAAGPGAHWIRGLRTGAWITVLTGRHRPLREHGTRRLCLGDGCALGTIDAYARTEHITAIEVSSEALRPLADRWPRHHFVAAEGAPGDALQSWLEQASVEGGLAGADGALLLGHAQSIQRQRRTLVDGGILPRRAITTKPYWATGKQGL